MGPGHPWVPPLLVKAAEQLRALPELTAGVRLARGNRFRKALPHLMRALEITKDMHTPLPLATLTTGAAALAARNLGKFNTEDSLWEKLTKSRTQHGVTHNDTLQPIILEARMLNALNRGDRQLAKNISSLAHAFETTSDELTSRFCIHDAHAELFVGHLSLATGNRLSSLVAKAPANSAMGDAANLMLSDHAYRRECQSDVSSSSPWVSLSKSFQADLPKVDMPDENSTYRKLAIGSRLAAYHSRLGEQRKESLALLERCLSIAEGKLGKSHPLVHSVVADMGITFAQLGEGVMAEGLFNSAIDGLRSNYKLLAAENEDLPKSTPAACGQALVTALESAASVVGQMSWNGTLRTADANKMRAEADAIRRAMPELFRGLGYDHSDCAGRKEWSGLEFWYLTNFEFAFLEILRNEDS